jgi:hypothetical protein
MNEGVMKQSLKKKNDQILKEIGVFPYQKPIS